MNETMRFSPLSSCLVLELMKPVFCFFLKNKRGICYRVVTLVNLTHIKDKTIYPQNGNASRLICTVSYLFFYKAPSSPIMMSALGLKEVRAPLIVDMVTCN